MKQSDAFLQGEGAAWFERNEHKLTGEDDPVLEALEIYGVKPKQVLEVGCANGWRLDVVRKKYKCWADGIDPAGLSGYREGAADDLSSFPSNCFDLLIYGFCLYLCDPEDYFRIAMEGDRVLREGGHLIVYDFCTSHPYKVPYKHKKGLFSHHYDFSQLWGCHPAYKFKGRTIQEETCVTILQKKMQSAFPVEE